MSNYVHKTRNFIFTCFSLEFFPNVSTIEHQLVDLLHWKLLDFDLVKSPTYSIDVDEHHLVKEDYLPVNLFFYYNETEKYINHNYCHNVYYLMFTYLFSQSILLWTSADIANASYNVNRSDWTSELSDSVDSTAWFVTSCNLWTFLIKVLISSFEQTSRFSFFDRSSDFFTRSSSDNNSSLIISDSRAASLSTFNTELLFTTELTDWDL